jgi:hypothetical protein
VNAVLKDSWLKWIPKAKSSRPLRVLRKDDVGEKKESAK